MERLWDDSADRSTLPLSSVESTKLTNDFYLVYHWGSAIPNPSSRYLTIHTTAPSSTPSEGSEMPYCSYTHHTFPDVHSRNLHMHCCGHYGSVPPIVPGTGEIDLTSARHPHHISCRASVSLLAARRVMSSSSLGRLERAVEVRRPDGFRHYSAAHFAATVLLARALPG